MDMFFWTLLASAAFWLFLHLLSGILYGTTEE
jgi:hypothetical protein